MSADSPAAVPFDENAAAFSVYDGVLMPASPGQPGVEVAGRDSGNIARFLAVDTLGRLLFTLAGGPSTSTVTSVAQTMVSTTLLAANATRLGALVHNASASIMYVKFGAGATTADFSFQLFPGGTDERQFPSYTGEISGVWAAAGSGKAAVTELTT